VLIRVIQISARGKRPAFANQPSRKATASREATAWLTDTTLFWSKRIYDFFEARLAAQQNILIWESNELFQLD
jgi:hypothetical protein